uniref:Glucose-methanol-choline oxidoreductase N-terminal domain-containing protein n=1 Tax=Oryza glumipatula TaxID=40148 RepID=A0A0E0ACQ7_9ORYZ
MSIFSETSEATRNPLLPDVIHLSCSRFPPLPNGNAALRLLRSSSPPKPNPLPQTLAPPAMAAIPTRLHLLLAALLVAPTLAAAQPRGFGGVVAPPPAYARYVVDAAETAAEEAYDYIVVGGGTAGCPLAATLAGPGGGRKS